MNKTLILLALAVLAILVDFRELATGLVLVAGVLILLSDQRKQQAITALAQELEAKDAPISYPFLVKAAMDWAQAGKSYYLPKGEDKADPQILYVGLKSKDGFGGQSFLPELEVTQTHIDRLKYLD